MTRRPNYAPAHFVGAVMIVGGGLFLQSSGPSSGIGMVLSAIAFGLLVSAVVTLMRSVEERATPWGAADILWLIAIVALPLVGPLVWFGSGIRLMTKAGEAASKPF